MSQPVQVTSASGHRIEVTVSDGVATVVGHDIVGSDGRRHPAHSTAMFYALRKTVGMQANVTFMGQMTVRVYRVEE